MTAADRTWWLVVTRRWTLCRDCGRALAEGEPSVYRHEPRMVLCDVCAVLRGIRPTASRTYLARRSA